MANIRCGHCKETHTAVVQVARCAEHARDGHVEYVDGQCPQCAIEKETYEEGLAQSRAHQFAENWIERAARWEP